MMREKRSVNKEGEVPCIFDNWYEEKKRQRQVYSDPLMVKKI